MARLVERAEIEVQGGAYYAVQLTFEEDSPYDCRIDPVTGTIPTEFEWDQKYATESEDLSRDQLRKIELGAGRELGVAGDDGTPRWGQAGAFTLDRDQIAAPAPPSQSPRFDSLLRCASMVSPGSGYAAAPPHHCCSFRQGCPDVRLLDAVVG